jgi:hypothetical protein
MTLSHLGDRATDLIAASAEGALYQLALVSSETDSFVADQLNEYEVRAAVRKIDRLLYSIRAFIEAQTGTPMEPAISDYFMSPRLNPHRLHGGTSSARAKRGQYSIGFREEAY